MTITPYIDLVTSQHKTKPNFIAWLSAALTVIDDTITVTNVVPSSFDVDYAIGAQLDVIGEIVGRVRVLNFQPTGQAPPVLDDTNYRIALKAKITQNQWDGTIPAVYELWNSLFPTITLSYVDNQNMTISALVDGQLDTVATEMVAAGYIIPKPAGVTLTIIEVTHISGTQYVGALVTGMDYITVYQQ